MKQLYFLLLVILALNSSCQKDESLMNDPYWIAGDPAQYGFHSDSISKAVNAAKNMDNFYALLVIRDNRLLVEEYFNNKDEDDLFHLRSITKNITSALTGIALEEGQINDVDSSIVDYFPEQLSGPKAQITLRSLLNMSSGLEWNENEEINDLIDHSIKNPIEYTLDKNLISSPGDSFNYNSIYPHIAARIIQEETRAPLRNYAKEKLFDPLSFGSFDWLNDPNGNSWGGLGLQLNARDMAKFGQLYLNGGAWDEKQIVPQNWVSESSQAQIQPYGPGSGYSFQWWTSENLASPIYYGQGYGGQALMLVPDKNVIILVFQEYYVPFDRAINQWNRFVSEVFSPIFNSIDQ